MLNITDPTVLKDLKAGIITQPELAKFLLSKYPVTQLADALADYMLENQYTKPIVISEEAFNAHFRIQGYRFENGQWVKETRGRKGATKECD